MEDITNLLGKRKRDDGPLQDGEKRQKTDAFTLGQLETAGREKYPDLVFASCRKEQGVGALTCSRRDMYNHPPLGIVSRVHVVIHEECIYDSVA